MSSSGEENDEPSSSFRFFEDVPERKGERKYVIDFHFDSAPPLVKQTNMQQVDKITPGPKQGEYFPLLSPHLAPGFRRSLVFASFR